MYTLAAYTPTIIAAAVAFLFAVLLWKSRPKTTPSIAIQGGGVAQVIPSSEIAKLLREQKPTPRGIFLSGPKAEPAVIERPSPEFREGIRVLSAIEARVEKTEITPVPVADLSVAPFCGNCHMQHSRFQDACAGGRA